MRSRAGALPMPGGCRAGSRCSPTAPTPRHCFPASAGICSLQRVAPKPLAARCCCPSARPRTMAAWCWPGRRLSLPPRGAVIPGRPDRPSGHQPPGPGVGPGARTARHRRADLAGAGPRARRQGRQAHDSFRPGLRGPGGTAAKAHHRRLAAGLLIEAQRAPMRFDIITLLPELFAPLLASGVTRRAYASGQVDVRLWNSRAYAEGHYRRVDDRPFGGGTDPVARGRPSIRAGRGEPRAGKAPLVLFSPLGEPLRHRLVQRWSSSAGAILLCGRYEGVDQPFIDALVDLQISLGDFVLSGGEIAAMALLDAV